MDKGIKKLNYYLVKKKKKNCVCKRSIMFGVRKSEN